MLRSYPLENLKRMLAIVIGSLMESNERLGRSDLVERVADEAREAFQMFSRRPPSGQDARSAAVAFMRGQELSERQLDLVAGALCIRIREASNAMPVGHPKFTLLLRIYKAQVKEGTLWRLVWFWLLGSYFSFNPKDASTQEMDGWEKLQSLLRSSWKDIDVANQGAAVPDWMQVLRGDPALLTENAAKRYAAEFLNGDDQRLKKLTADLSIPQSSWFYHALVLSAVEEATSQTDEQFKTSIRLLIAMIEKHPVYRDDAIELLLDRYYACLDRSVHPALRDYTVRVDVWRNPKLRSAGLANSWTRVSDPVWKMVLHWINEGNLRDFFQIIARRHNADEGRLDFWSGYLAQITWTRLIFSDETVRLKNRNAGIRELIAREEGAYATMYGIKDIDAFMMQIGRYIIVEFSVKGNAAYVYDSKTLKFDRDAESYHGGTEDLRYGFYDDKIELRIVHRPGWQAITQASLEKLGIHPDSRSTRKAVVPSASESQLQRWPSNPMSTAANQPSPAQSKPVPRTTWNFDDRHPSSIAAPRGAKFTMTELRLFVGKFPSAAVDDKRQGASGGRLWVEDTEQRVALAAKLIDWGFRWSDKRQAHFYPEE